MGPPGGQVQSYIRYGHGIDKTQETLMLACDLGLIQKAGAWFNCVFMSDCKKMAKKIKPEVNVDDEEALGEKYRKWWDKDKRTWKKGFKEHGNS